MAIRGRGVEVKKVKAYPFDAQLELAPGKLAQVSIMRLAPAGAMLTMQKVFLVVGKEYNLTFSLPVYNYSISAKIKIVKTVDEVKEDPGHKMRVERRAEVRFVSLTRNQKEAIEQFMAAIGQSH